MPVPHQPPNNIPLASSLPKVSFRKIPLSEIQNLTAPAGVHDAAHVGYGFNDGTEFDRPEHYLRHVEPIESELNKQVEYDMDEQDQEWLDAVNLDRRRDQLDAISYEVFEIIIDRLEKEWFDLMKRIPAKPFAVGMGPDGEAVADGNEDIACAICDDGECENSNAIVFCDGCNLAVHQDCYGIPYIPEGQWLCRKCTVSPDRAVSCVLCPHEGGAFKQTTQGKWAHLLCAMWIPETGVSNPVYMEPIDSIERVPKARWKLQCYLCNRRVGACIQCHNRSCFTAFHVTCARRAGLLLKSQRTRVTHTPDEDDDTHTETLMRAWCHKHLPKSVRAQRARDEQFQDAHSQPPSPSPPSPDKRRIAASLASPAKQKSARAYKKSYKAGPTLVPAFIVNRVIDYIARVPVRKKQQLTQQIAKFWSLKREARRGAPLLKRLHLEPWTTNTSSEQSDAERLQKLQFLLQLREDLEKVRMLAELTRKREKEKQRQLNVIKTTLVNGILFPFHSTLRNALTRIMALDRASVFLHPVSAQKVPDYYEIIKRPMDWSAISAKLDDYRYASVDEFKADVHLVLENAMIYNKLDTLYHRTAARILKVAEPIFEELVTATHIHALDKRHLALEADMQTVRLLQDYKGEEEHETPTPATNAIDDLMQHYYHVERPPPKPAKPDAAAKAKARQEAAEQRAADRALRSERSRLAHEKRRENERLAALNLVEQASTSAQADTSMAVSEGPRRTRRQTAEHDKSAAASRSSPLTEVASRRSSDSADAGALEVDKVNNRDSFKLFNSGWIMPSGMKRSRSRPEKMDAAQADDDVEMADERGTKRKRSVSSAALVRDDKKRARSESQGLPEQAQRRGAKSQKKGVRPDKNAKSPSKQAETDENADYPPSTLCWAKVGGYSFFPAEVFDPDDEDLVPANVRNKRPPGASAETDGTQPRLYLVRFFDGLGSFGWVPASRLHYLFEDEELDSRLLRAPKDKRQRHALQLAVQKARVQAQ